MTAAASARSMRALVYCDGGVRFEDRPIPTPGPDDVVVRTTAASICSADVAGVQDGPSDAGGFIVGHEAVGVVHRCGSAIVGFEPGQRVAVTSGTSCGQCANCQRGVDGHCGGVEWGAYSFGVGRDGSLAEFFLVPHANRNLSIIPDSVTDSDAVCATDTLASGSTGSEAADFPLGSTVAVFGQGHIGLGATVSARALGAGLVITVKARPGGEEVATRLGADVCLNLAEHDVFSTIDELTGGVGVDCAVEASGVVSSFPQAVRATRIGGTIAVLSSYSGPPSAALALPLADWGWGLGDKTIFSTFARTGSERLPRLLRLIERRRIDPRPLVTERYKFADADRAFWDVANRRQGLVKPLITF